MTKIPTRKIIFIQAGAALGVLAVVILLLTRGISRSIYEERCEMLQISTQTAASIVDDNTATQWKVFGIAHGIMEQALSDGMGVSEALKTVKRLHSSDGDYFFAVDGKGKYWSSDGVKGRLTDFSQYKGDSPDRVELLSTLPHMPQDTTYMIFRERVEEEVWGDIRYFGYAQEMSDLNRSIKQLYPGRSNVFIYDRHGIMLFKEFGITLLIEGYNIYPKFHQAELVFGEDPDEMVRKCRDKEGFAVRMNIGGQKYYFCSNPLSMGDLTLAFVIQADAIEAKAGDSLARIIYSIIAIAALLGLAIISIIIVSVNRRAAEQRLKDTRKVAVAMSEASKAKTDFLSNMSHDIRTPINGIMGVTTIAKGAIGDPVKIKDCLDKIDGASHHLLSLINDVLDMSRIESGKTSIDLKPCDLRVLCDNCCSIIGGQLAERDLEFIKEIDVRHTAVLADDLHLRQVLINILGNAVKFTRDGGKIWFRCIEQEAGEDGRPVYRFEVEDTGIGMSAKFLEKIFEPFSQADNGARGKYKGTGLGMAITQQLTTLMGGTVSVESEEGKGSRFTVLLPFEIDTEVHESQDAVAQDADIEGVRILLVEDNELNSEIATELLRMSGAEVDIAWNGREALDLFAGSEPGRWDIILMDVMMPEMNGIEATRAIRALDRQDALTIPIVAMTANAFDDDIKATREAGMNAHLSKPINITEVIGTIAKFRKKA